MTESYYADKATLEFTALTPQQEKELVRQSYAGEQAATEELLHAHLKFIAKHARRVARNDLDEKEAISAANEAVVVLLSRKMFDPNFGARFSSYIKPFIRGAVLAAIRERNRFVGLGVLNRIETHAIDAVLTGRATIIEEVQERPWYDTSRTFMDRAGSTRLKPAGEDLSVEPVVEQKDFEDHRAALLQAAMAKLKPHHRLVIECYYLRDMDLPAIARAHGKTISAWSAALIRASARLKKLLAANKSELL